jgi:hypothetical protein
MHGRELMKAPRLALVAWGVCALVGGSAPCVAQAADALDRLQVATEAERAQAGGAWVHCLLPGQVRRLGLSVVPTPRRAVRVSPAECLAAGGEYVEPQDTLGALKIWLPLAADGMPEAQATAGELYEQQGQPKLARVWYEKAAAAGVARAQFNLASLEVQSGAATPGSDRTQQLLAAASGGWVAGLVMAPREQLRIDVVAPEAAMRLPRPVDGVLTVEAGAQARELVARVVAPAGLKSVKVNGQSMQPDAHGLLQVALTATPPGAAQDAAASVAAQAYAFEAVGTDGALARTEVRVLQRSSGEVLPSLVAKVPPEQLLAQAPTASGAAAPHLPTVAAPTGRRWALMIANQAYAQWGALDTPVSDAQAVGEVLRDRYGFDVQWVRNATRAQMLQALQALRARVGPQDQVLVYYAGHGQMDSVTARGYWIPVDGDKQDISRWVSVIDVTDQLSAMQARHAMVIADSCYSGTLTHSLMPRIDTALAEGQRRQALEFLSRQKVRVAMTSGGLEPVLDGGSIEHSLFARSLLDVLRQVQAPVAALELHQAVAARFAHLGRRLQVQQQPHYAPIAFAGHEAGDFVLSPR